MATTIYLLSRISPSATLGQIQEALWVQHKVKAVSLALYEDPELFVGRMAVAQVETQLASGAVPAPRTLKVNGIESLCSISSPFALLLQGAM
ncbi:MULTISPECIES: hypothetical protein [unclassified Pseudomonas]|uniref:hypothetical protein n=1 Tax=unclassified Pseudomonas TaxID=196821 RepID=UPI00117AB7A5|nr:MULTISPECIES: hypothetical protein [unclassified Pseudomonas]